MQLISEAITAGQLEAIKEKVGALDGHRASYRDVTPERHSERTPEDVADRLAKQTAKRARRIASARA